MFQPPKGTKDFMPEEMKKLQFVLDVVRGVFEKYGFQPLETPAFESFDLLARKSGEDIKEEIYYFKDKAGRELGLRFDLTVPMARIVASNPSLPKPFKRYQIGKVWRYDQPQAGRFREFWQADVDIVGSENMEADVECLAVACECMQKLGFKNFFIRINNRKLLQDLVLKAGISKNKILDLFRSIDKLDKIGWEGVERELKSKKIENKEILEVIKKDWREIKIESEGLNELKELLEIAEIFGIKKYLKVDLSLVRGLEYYTGPVFEIMAGGKWSCGGGGRYDNLVEALGGGLIPATGISLGINRIIGLMKENGLFKLEKEKMVYIAPVEKNVKNNAIKILQELRKAGIKAEIDLMNRKLSKQLEYVNSKGILWVIIVGEKDLKEGKVTLKNMETGEEKKIKKEEIVKVLES